MRNLFSRMLYSRGRSKQIRLEKQKREAWEKKFNSLRAAVKEDRDQLELPLLKQLNEREDR